MNDIILYKMSLFPVTLLFLVTCYDNCSISLGLKILWASKFKIKEKAIVDSKNEIECDNYILLSIFKK